MKKLLFLIPVFLFMFLTAQASSIFADTFTRSDQSGWGIPSDGSAAWTDTGDAGSGYSSFIQSNLGVMSSNNNGTPWEYHAFPFANTYTATFTLNTQFGTSGDDIEFLSSSNGTKRNGYGFRIAPDGAGNANLYIRDAGTDLVGPVSIPFPTNTDMHFEVDVDSSNVYSVYEWTTGSKPGTPQIMFNNSGLPYTVVSTGTNLEILSSSNSFSNESSSFSSLNVVPFTTGGGGGGGGGDATSTISVIPDGTSDLIVGSVIDGGKAFLEVLAAVTGIAMGLLVFRWGWKKLRKIS